MNTKVELASFNNSWYKPGGKLKIALWYWVNIVFFIAPIFPFSKAKVVLLRIFGAKIGRGVVIKQSVNIKYPWFLVVGNNTWIGEKVWIDNLANVEIGNDVCISQGAMLLTGNHNYKKSTFDLMVKEIIIEDGVWIGAKSIVTPGIHCKSHSILSVGSVACSNLEAYTIYKGNPAVSIRERKVV